MLEVRIMISKKEEAVSKLFSDAALLIPSCIIGVVLAKSCGMHGEDVLYWALIFHGFCYGWKLGSNFLPLLVGNLFVMFFTFGIRFFIALIGGMVIYPIVLVIDIIRVVTAKEQLNTSDGETFLDETNEE